MAGPDPATHRVCVSGRNRVIRRAGARLMGGRLEGGHDD